MKNILGTGLSGLVGTRLCELLAYKYNFANLDITSGIDITDRNLIEKEISLSKSDALIHLAAFTDVDKAWEQNQDKNGLCYKINVLGTKNIADACYKTNKYLIHISTDFIFDGENPPAGGYTEDDKPNPIEWYGQTKAWAEDEVKNSGTNNIILRIAFPFSPKPFTKLDLVHKIIQKLKNRETLKMFFDTVITPTFIDDIANVIDYCIERKPIGLYHCVGSSQISPYNLASLIAQVFDFDKTLIRKETIRSCHGRPRQINLAISNQKLINDFELKMHKVEDALKLITSY